MYINIVDFSSAYCGTNQEYVTMNSVTHLPRIPRRHDMVWVIVDRLTKSVLRPNYIYKFMILLPKDYYLIPNNCAKKLLRPNYVCDVISVCQTFGSAT